MNRIAISLLIVGLLGGCSTLDKVKTPRGMIYSTRVGVDVYQGADANGIFLGEVRKQGRWFYLPGGLELLHVRFSNGRGGEAGVTLNMQAGQIYYFVLDQKPGYITPDVTITQTNLPSSVTIPPTKTGMAQIYLVYKGGAAATAAVERQKAKMEQLQNLLGCSHQEMRQGTCQ